MRRLRFKILTFLIFCLTILSCKNEKKVEDNSKEQKPNWSEEQKWKYFQDSIAYNNKCFDFLFGKDSLNNFKVFSKIMFADIKAKNKQNPCIYALEESYIDTTKIDSNKFWFRITVAPAFRRPYCLVVEKKNNKTYITGKMTDGFSGCPVGLLDFSITKIFSDSIYNNISQQLHQLDFWNLEMDNICRAGTDGEAWTFESIENGKYNIINRYVPWNCEDNATKKLGLLGLNIREKSKMLEVFALTNNIDLKKLNHRY